MGGKLRLSKYSIKDKYYLLLNTKIIKDIDNDCGRQTLQWSLVIHLPWHSCPCVIYPLPSPTHLGCKLNVYSYLQLNSANNHVNDVGSSSFLTWAFRWDYDKGDGMLLSGLGYMRLWLLSYEQTLFLTAIDEAGWNVGEILIARNWRQWLANSQKGPESPQFNNLPGTEYCQQPSKWLWKQIFPQLSI